MSGPPTPVRWVSFEDDDHTTWLFDLTFLTSGWSCTFGSTCRGTEPGDNGARGCCAHGAHLVDDEERRTIVDLAARLDPRHWYNHDRIATEEDLFVEVDDGVATSRLDEACVFLNPPGFAGGHGCALHLGALASGERPLDWKPTVCWQLPFRLEEYDDDAGTRTVALRAWRRSDWGEGGEDFGWWCTEHVDPAPPGSRTWEHHLDELVELVGEEPVGWLRAHLEDRAGSAETPVRFR